MRKIVSFGLLINSFTPIKLVKIYIFSNKTPILCVYCITMRLRQYTSDQIKFITENYTELGVGVCSQETNLPVPKVKYIAGILKLAVSTQTRIQTMKETKSKIIKPAGNYKVNHEEFFNINDPSKAYLLGLLWADGSCRCSLYNENNDHQNDIRLSSTYPDAYEFIEVFNKTGDWSIYSRQPNKLWKPNVAIITNNKNFAKQLYDLDFHKRTQGFDKILDFIPKKYIHSFLLGYSDGDGCFYADRARRIYKFSYCSNFDQDWKSMENILNELQIKYKIERSSCKTGKHSKLHIGGQGESSKFGDFLYQSRNLDGLGLNRKYEKYLIIKSRYNEWQEHPKYNNCHSN